MRFRAELLSENRVTIGIWHANWPGSQDIQRREYVSICAISFEYLTDSFV
jgi:hypothetical protein